MRTRLAVQIQSLFNLLGPPYACSVVHPLPAFQLQRLQRLQNACAGFVTRRFAGAEDAAKLNWLPVNTNVELNILNLAHKSLYDESFSEYLKLNLHKVSAYLRLRLSFLFRENQGHFSTRQELFLINSL